MATDTNTQEDQSSSPNPVAKKVAHSVLHELGLVNVYSSPRDVKVLFAQRFVRLFAYGGSTLVLVSYLSALGFAADKIGLFMTLTLVGDVAISFLITLFADAMGRRAVLALGALLMSGSGIVFGLSGNYWVLLVGAIVGVISPNGNEIGPFRAVEESSIAHLCETHILADTFAWYTLVGSAGGALGMLVCGWIFNALQSVHHYDFISACRALFFIYAAMGFVKFLLTLLLTKRVERETPDAAAATDPTRQPLLQNPEAAAREEPPKKPSIFSLDRQAKQLMLQLCLLFALDSFASGLVPLSWITFFFKQKFALSEGRLGSIFFATSIVQAASSLCAASIARRIGNVKTMVFTHTPSAICLALIPLPSTLWLSLVFLIGRACTQQMDVAPRSAFLAAALPKDQRTAMMGFINVVKTTSSSVGPYVTGSLARANLFWVSFVVAGSLKATYDIGILLTFAGRDKSKPKNTPQTSG